MNSIDLLITRYLDGETTPDEERQLALAVSVPDAPPEWRIIAEMLGELTIDAARYDDIMAQRNTNTTKRITRRIARLWPWTAAAACIAVGIVLSYNIINEPVQEAAKIETHRPTEAAHVCEPAHRQLFAQNDRSKENNSESENENTQPPSQPQEPPILERPLEGTEPPLEEHLIEVQEPQQNVDQDADFALHLALLAEVESRVLQIEQNAPTPTAFTTFIDSAPQQERAFPLMERDERGLLLDELLANIQQLSNRPELSL